MKARRPTKTSKREGSRPTIYHPYWGERIESHLAQGWSLRRFCQKPGNPAMATVMSWLKDPSLVEFHEHHARGREAAGDADADFVGYVNEEVMHGRMDANVGRVVIDARKWQAGIRKPKKYGAKVEHSGSVDGNIHVTFAAEDEKIM